MMILGHADVVHALAGREAETIDVVAGAYRLHDERRTAVPHSAFLRFPGDSRNRIIALPAFVGSDPPAAGMKWVSSFPGNLGEGLPRASAVVVLNSMETGRPEALIEGSLISARRTAASAALAARVLLEGRPAGGVSLIGCGFINREVLRFLLAVWPGLPVTLYDIDPGRAAAFARGCADLVPDARVTLAADLPSALTANELISIATTAADPHMDVAGCAPGSVVLHLSLRDLTVDAILASQNVVDDPDHVCRERTSPHLAEQATGNRGFIDASIGGLLRGSAEFRRDPAKVLVFSPFGLGALDIALARFVQAEALRAGCGVTVDDFLP